MVDTAVLPMPKKSAKQPDSRTVRITFEAYQAARKVSSLRAEDLTVYLSRLILAHAPRDLRDEIRKLDTDGK